MSGAMKFYGDFIVKKTTLLVALILALNVSADEVNNQDYSSLLWTCKSDPGLLVSVNKIMRPDTNDNSKPDRFIKYQMMVRKDSDSEDVNYEVELKTVSRGAGKASKSKKTQSDKVVIVNETFTSTSDSKIVLNIVSETKEGEQAKVNAASILYNGKKSELTCQ